MFRNRITELMFKYCFQLLFLQLIFISTINAQNDFSLEKPNGKKLYETHCQKCHQADGKGLVKVFPPLAKSDFLKNYKAVVKAIAHGMNGEIVVNGIKYNQSMPKPNPELSSEEITEITNFIYTNFGNKPKKITQKQVEKVLAEKK